MALADYRLCDVCSSKVFCDSNLYYEFEEPGWEDFDEVDKSRGFRLGCLGDWKVLCKGCLTTHEVVIKPREQ